MKNADRLFQTCGTCRHAHFPKPETLIKEGECRKSRRIGFALFRAIDALTGGPVRSYQRHHKTGNILVKPETPCRVPRLHSRWKMYRPK